MLAKLFAVAAGCTFAVVSFDAGAVPALPLPLQQTMHVTQIAGGCEPGWHRGPWRGGFRRNWGPVGRHCWFRPTPWGGGACAAGENVRLKFENPAGAGFFV
ncbi:MAG: hypothetical protein WA624_04635 [Methylocella sp.]